MPTRYTLEYTFLYRLLREDEFPLEEGLSPKDPNADVSVHNHVDKGSSIVSRFISTSASWEALLNFARKSRTQPDRIAMINVKELESEEMLFYDLTNPRVQNQYLHSRRAHNRANKMKEVLFTGTIPNYCIYYVADIECKHKFLYRLLRRNENTSEGLVAKDKEADITVDKFILDGSSIASQFVSTCASFKAVKLFSQNAYNRSKRVSKINVRRLIDSACAGFIDLTERENRELYLKNEDSEDDALKRARNFCEVLVIGDIPADCIDEVIVL